MYVYIYIYILKHQRALRRRCCGNFLKLLIINFFTEWDKLTYCFLTKVKVWENLQIEKQINSRDDLCWTNFQSLNNKKLLDINIVKFDMEFSYQKIDEFLHWNCWFICNLCHKFLYLDLISFIFLADFLEAKRNIKFEGKRTVYFMKLEFYSDYLFFCWFYNFAFFISWWNVCFSYFHLNKFHIHLRILEN